MKNFEDFIKEHPNIKASSKLYEHTNQSSETNIEKNKATNEKYASIEEFDKIKTKVLKYVLYKKRTEQEIRQKFLSTVDQNVLEDVVQNLKENGYINDFSYIERAVNEFMAIKTLSIKEMKIKLYSKGISNNIIDEYFNENQETLELYEISCIKKIVSKKKTNMDDEEIQNYLYKKGYKNENIKIAFEELEN